MKNTLTYKRRRFLASSLKLGLGALILPYSIRMTQAASARGNILRSALVDILQHQESARIIGLEYLKAAPLEADPQQLATSIVSALTDQPTAAQAQSPERLRQLLQRRLRSDFEEGRIVRLQGWVLAITEARLCALTVFA